MSEKENDKIKIIGKLLFNLFVVACILFLTYDIIFNLKEYYGEDRSFTSKQNGYILFILIINSISPVLVYLVAFFQLGIVFLFIKPSVKLINRLIKK